MIIAVDPGSFCQIDRFVVCNSSVCLTCIDADLIVPVDVNACQIRDAPVLIQTAYTIVGIDITYIFVAEIMAVTVDKFIVCSGNRIIFNAIA